MPVPGGMYQQQQGPSCLDRMKTGFMLGFCIGMASGAIFGGFGALRYFFLSQLKTSLKVTSQYELYRMGLRGRDLVNNVGKVMLQGGGTFGTFMGIHFTNSAAYYFENASLIQVCFLNFSYWNWNKMLAAIQSRFPI